MGTTPKMKAAAVLFSCILLSGLSVGFGGELIEPTRTLQDPEKTWGGLTVFSEPPQLEVYVDGEKAGQTPLWLRRVETGLHTIRIGDAQTSVRIEAEKRLKVGFLRGSFVISSEPAKEKAKVLQPAEQQTVAPSPAPAAEEETTKDLSHWEKFVNGTLKHF